MQNALKKLFYRIDANCDGTVDWDEFSLYMLLEQQGTAEISEDEHRRALTPPAMLARPVPGDAHAKIIDCCTLVPPCGGASTRYATGARDGNVKLWDCKVRCRSNVPPRPPASSQHVACANRRPRRRTSL